MASAERSRAVVKLMLQLLPTSVAQVPSFGSK